jgi:uncharacterized cupredoxin-like copper-binding protein
MKKMFAVTAFAVVLAACGGDETASKEELKPMDEPTRGTVAIAESGQTVVVSIDDNVIGMNDTVPPGPTVFTVTNNGSKPHNFVVSQDILDWRLEQDLQPGQSASVQLDLKAGTTYRASCPLDGHVEQLNFSVSR